ncbi:MAG: ABC transporter ATP-binding protein [Chloroflexi bacterium]|nr:ABC transporter ATP-binding protein [Chloroflexota bacterium]
MLALLLFASIGLQLVNPQILRFFIDGATSGSSAQILATAGLLFLGAAIVQQACAVLATYFGESIAWTATNALRVDLAAHCLRLDLAFHKTRTPGELIERIDGDVTALANFFSRFVIGIVGNLLLLLGVLVLFFREDWRIGLVESAFAFAALYALLHLRAIAVPHWLAVREKSAKFYGFVGEHLAATEDLRANGATAYVMRRFYELLREWFPFIEKSWVAALSMEGATRFIFGIGIAMAFALGAYFWSNAQISIGTVYIVFYYTELLFIPLMQLRDQMRDLQMASAGVTRVQELFNTTPTIKDGPGHGLPADALRVHFNHVSFAYESDENVLHDLSFDLAPGKVLGLLGRTGSGKTTLARLLFRLYDTTAGEISLSGVPIRSARLAELRQRVGMVTQDVQLFDGTLRDNITFFNRSIPDEQIIAVLDELELRTWFDSLAGGLDKELKAGSGLSVGEAQLVAFARVFLKSPGLVILDEASSHLDPGTEALIERAVTRLLRNRTGIVIAHRLATVQRADEILILDQGHIQEYGARVELARDPASRFSQLLRVGMDEVLA